MNVWTYKRLIDFFRMSIVLHTSYGYKLQLNFVDKHEKSLPGTKPLAYFFLRIGDDLAPNVYGAPL